jgi:hypothetical protein
MSLGRHDGSDHSCFDAPDFLFFPFFGMPLALLHRCGAGERPTQTAGARTCGSMRRVFPLTTCYYTSLDAAPEKLDNPAFRGCMSTLQDREMEHYYPFLTFSHNMAFDDLPKPEVQYISGSYFSSFSVPTLPQTS